jgi:inorganic phosphate transporter, PiT family
MTSEYAPDANGPSAELASTTHTVTGAIMGVGVTSGINSVKWGVAKKIIWAWILTIPFSAIMGALIYMFISMFI